MDSVDYTRFIFSFIFVIALIGLCGMLLKKYVGSEKFLSLRNSTGRLKIIEIRHIDSKRKLVLVKRDEVEHLLFINDTNQTVLETCISKKADV